MCDICHLINLLSHYWVNYHCLQIIEKSAQKDNVEGDEERYNEATTDVAEEGVKDTEVSNE